MCLQAVGGSGYCVTAQGSRAAEQDINSDSSVWVVVSFPRNPPALLSSMHGIPAMKSALNGMTGTCCSPCLEADSSDESESYDCVFSITYSGVLKDAGLCVHEMQLQPRRGEEAMDDYVMETQEADDELLLQSELNVVEEQILSLSRRILFGGARWVFHLSSARRIFMLQ